MPDFKTETVENTSEAQKLLMEHSFDAVFTTISVMANMDGIEFLKNGQEALPDLQVVMVTGDPVLIRLPRLFGQALMII